MQRYTHIEPMKEQEPVGHQVTISASEGHRGFGKLLKRVFGSDDHVIIERDGYRVAVMMSYQEYEKLQQLQSLAAFDQYSQELGQEVETQGLTEEEMLVQIKESRQEVYNETYGNTSKK